MEIQKDIDVLRKATSSIAEWEEEKHPRARGGKFAPKGTTKPSPEDDDPKDFKRRGVEDDVFDHKGTWESWNGQHLFVRYDEGMEEARERTNREVEDGEWGPKAKKLLTDKEAAEEKRSRGKRRSPVKEEQQRARAEWEGEENVPKFTREQFRMIEDAKKALVQLGNSKEESKRLVHEAARIGWTDLEDLIRMALGGKKMTTAPKREAPKPEKKPEEKKPDAPSKPKPDAGKREYDKFIDEYFGEEKKPDPDLDLEEDDLLEQLFGAAQPEEEKPDTPDPWDRAAQEVEEEERTKGGLVPVEETPADWREGEEDDEAEHQQLVDAWEPEDVSDVDVDQLFEELFPEGVPPPPEMLGIDEAQAERRKREEIREHLEGERRRKMQARRKS